MNQKSKEIYSKYNKISREQEKSNAEKYTVEYISSLVEADEQRNLRLYRERVKHINFKN